MIETSLTRMLGIRYPIVGAPMFLVSNVEMVVAISEAGGLGAMPSLNFRSTEAFREAVEAIQARTSAPFAVNLILLGNDRLEADLAVCLERRVPVVVTSLGDPTELTARAHEAGLRVFSDVTTLRHARKCVQAGVDALVAVASGAGGHAGTVSPLVLVPQLLQHVQIPVLAAGGIATGAQMAAVLALGAAGAYVGTRFIASTEAPVPDPYRQALVDLGPEDIEYSADVTGHPANFLRPSLENFRARREEAGKRPGAWRDVWSAGHGLGLIHDIRPCARIVEQLVQEYEHARLGLPPART